MDKIEDANDGYCCDACNKIVDGEETGYPRICKECENKIYSEQAIILKKFLRTKGIFNISHKTALECILLIKGE